jgi:hypothetical protein
VSAFWSRLKKYWFTGMGIGTNMALERIETT